jgi:hypothetical protein
MKISRHIKFFMGFALVVLLDFGLSCLSPSGDFVLRRLLGLQGETRLLAYLIYWLVLLISVLGMIGSLITWLIAGMVAECRRKAGESRARFDQMDGSKFYRP